MRRTLALISIILPLAGCLQPYQAPYQASGLVFCSEGNPSSFNPQLDASGTTVDASAHQIYDRLIDFDPDTSSIVPALSSSWLVSDDGLIYTFQLRKQVSYHSTPYFTPSRYFNADDVLFSINRWRDTAHPYHPVSGGHYPYFSSLGLGDVIEDVKRINGYRVEIHLTKPDSSFLANLATDFSVILSAEYAEQLLQQGKPSDIDHKPIGTGPYQFVEYREGEFIRYRQHPEYWQVIKRPQNLIFDITSSSSQRLAKLMTGECDAIALPAHSELEVIRNRNDLRLEERPGLNIGFWAFNTQKAPFDNAEVRRALAMAVDKNALIEAVYFGNAERAHGIVPPASWAYEQKNTDINYNPVLARQLLENQGVGSFDMDIWAMPVERAYNPNATKMAELIQSYLAEIGVTANIISYEWSAFRQQLRQGQHDSVLIGWSADNGDPDNFYRPLLTCAAISSGTNRARWCEPQFDDLIEEALLHTDTELRKTYYHLANAILAEQMPLVPIAHAYRYQAFHQNVSGLRINPFGGIRLGDVEKQ